MCTSTLAVAILLVLSLSLFSLPLSHGAALHCSAGSCDLDFGSVGCSTCASNSSQCANAWFNSTGQSCGQALMVSRQSNGHHHYPTCCPTSYPCVPNSYVYVENGVTYDVTSYWCTKNDPASVSDRSSTTHLTWLWWLLACAGGSVLFYAATYLYRRHQARTYAASQQQQWQSQPQQELLGQPGPWSDDVAAERHHQAIRQPPAGLLPTYLPPGTYAQMQ